MSEIEGLKAKNIVRIDQPERNQHGWQVVMEWKRKVYRHWERDDPDAVTSFKRAVRWRNEKEIEIGKPRTERRVVGVSPFDRDLPMGVTVHGNEETGRFYRACWFPEAGKMATKDFAVSEHGEEGALQKAIEHRKEMERELYGAEIG